MNEKLFIRISRKHIAFAVFDPADTAQPVSYQSYQAKAGISIAANMREAFKTEPLLSASYQRVMVLINSPVLMVPIDLYDEQQKETFYLHSFPSQRADCLLTDVLPDLSCVAIYAVGRDLKMVIDDHFPQAQYLCSNMPVWRHLHQRSFTGLRSKLYAYFHDDSLELFSFQQNRFKFCNTFEVTSLNDSLYFLLYVWRQLNLQQQHDELHLVGDIPHQKELMAELRRYLRRAYVINPTADFNRQPITQIKGMPYDLMTLIVKGR